MTRDELERTAWELNRYDNLTYTQIAEQLADHYMGRLAIPTRGWVARLVANECKRRESATPADTRAGADRGGLRETHPLSLQGGENTSADTMQEPSTDAKRRALKTYLVTSWNDPGTPPAAPVHTRRVCGIGDLHGDPDPLVTAALINAQPDVIVIGGDLTDQQQAGRHGSETKQEAKRRRRRTLRDELTSVRAWLETLLDQTTAQVLVFRGNHDQWAFKRAYDLLPDYLLDQFNDPLDVLLSDLGARVTVVGQPVVYTHSNGTQQRGGTNEFMFVYGDALFSHLNYAQSATETAVSKLHRQWFINWRRTLDIDHVRVLVQFHSHGRALRSVEGGHMLLVEPGMGGSIAVEAYKVSYNSKWRPGVQGFVALTQHRTGEAWRTDLGSVQLVAPRMAAGKGEA